MFGLGLITTAIKGVGNYFTEKQKQKGLKIAHTNQMEELQRQSELEVVKATGLAKIEFAKTGQAQDYDLDRIAMQNMEKSYKDEFFLLVFIVPMIMAFIPKLQDVALKGFQVIEKMPDWYTYMIVGMGVVIYGMRGLLKWLLNSKNKLLKVQT